MLEMVVDRRHQEDTLARALVDQHLDHDRQRLDHEQAADDDQHELVVRRDSNRAESPAEREAARVAHEDRRGRGVEPEEGEARSNDRQAQHSQVADAEDVGNAEVSRELRVADQVGDQEEGEAGDDHRHGRKAVEPVGQGHGIAERHDHEGAERDVEPAEIEHGPLDEGQVEVGGPGPDDHPGCETRDQEFEREPSLAGKTRVMRLLHLVIVVKPADHPEPGCDEQTGPDVGIAELHPEQDRDDHRDEDEEPAHRRRATLGEVRLRPDLADRLALALRRPQVGDEPGTEQQADEERGRACRAGAEADVADQVEDAGKAQLLGAYVEHGWAFTTLSTSFASPTELDALTRTASPGWSIRRSVFVASSTSRARSSPSLPTTCSASGRISSPMRISSSTWASSTAGARFACSSALCSPSSRIGPSTAMRRVTSRSAPRLFNVAAIEAGLAL